MLLPTMGAGEKSPRPRRRGARGVRSSDVGILGRLGASGHIHDDVGRRFLALLPKGSRVLDLPAGDGVNSRGLAAAGFRVTAADLFPGGVTAEGCEILKADLCKPFPFPDASFDGVLFSEGIEHLDAQVAALREMARVLRPGGFLVVTTPNVLNLAARFGAMLTGHAHPARALVVRPAGTWAGDPGKDAEVYFGHVFLINAFQLRFYLEHAGFEVTGVDTARWSVNSLLLWPPMGILVWLSTFLALRNRRSKVPPALRREILGQACSPSVMFGRKLIMIARRRGA